IAGFVYQGQATKYMQQGDKTKSEKYSKVAKRLGVATITCSSLTVCGIVAVPIAMGLQKRGL
ncbi:MAG: hypothetical protein IKE05_04795, partial [Clostridia bacterium]|nr:hypothetical protein [Clostridia bacterium]